MKPPERDHPADDASAHLEPALRAELEQALAAERLARRSLEFALSAGGDGFALFEVDSTADGGPRLRLRCANAVARAAFDLRPGERLAPCLAPRPSARIWGLVWEVLQYPDRGPRRARLDPDRPDSGAGPWDVTVVPAGSDQAVVTWRDATGCEETRQRPADTVTPIEHTVTHDAATGLPNGVLLRGALAQALGSGRSGGRVAVVLCSLNGLFDAVSRRHGAPAGIALLQAAADRLRGQLRRSDVAARLGADTFALVLGWPATDADPARVFGRIADALAQPLAVHTTLLVPTVSIGIVIIDPEQVPDDPEQMSDALILRAFEAMRRSRATGRPIVLPENDVEVERARVKMLESYDVHDGALDEVFHAAAHLAADACAAPYALVTFIDADLQWVRAVAGVKPLPRHGLVGPRHLALCDVAVRRRRLVVMPDLRDDARCATRHLGFQEGRSFYAGAPLVDREGWVLGTICVLDDIPRGLTGSQRRALTGVADALVSLLEARRSGSG